jgi:hypothetical protein
MIQKIFSAIKGVSSAFIVLFIAFSVSGCAQMIADSMFGDQYLKPITKSREIHAQSQKQAVNAAVSAAGKTEWTPKTISVETGYVLAENVPTVKGMNAARNYAFKLEVRLPETGKGEATIIITPPQGLVSSTTMEEIANKYLDALVSELGAKKK